MAPVSFPAARSTAPQFQARRVSAAYTVDRDTVFVAATLAKPEIDEIACYRSPLMTANFAIVLRITDMPGLSLRLPRQLLSL